MRYFARFCILLAALPLIVVAFVLLIGTQGNDAADDLVIVLQTWLHS